MITLRPEQYAINSARPVKFTATFPDGHTFKRSSKRPYTHAWRVKYTENGQPQMVGGFSSARDLAQSVAEHWVRRLNKWAADPRNVADKIEGLTIEVVGVQS